MTLDWEDEFYGSENIYGIFYISIHPWGYFEITPEQSDLIEDEWEQELYERLDNEEIPF